MFYYYEETHDHENSHKTKYLLWKFSLLSLVVVTWRWKSRGEFSIQINGQQKEQHCAWLGLLKLQSYAPRDTLPPTHLTYFNKVTTPHLSQCYFLVPKHSNPWAYGAFLFKSPEWVILTVWILSPAKSRCEESKRSCFCIRPFHLGYCGSLWGRLFHLS